MHQWKLMTGLDCDELRMAWVMTYLKEPVCPFAGTFVMIVGALVTWAIYTQRQTPVMLNLDHNRSCPWV